MDAIQKLREKLSPATLGLICAALVVLLPMTVQANEPSAAGLDWFKLLVGLGGGLAIFLFGMEEMSNTLKIVAGERIKKIIQTLSGNRFAGVLTGGVTTALVQSSSVTTVIVVGFVSAGLMTLPQSLGVILGANIGTTVTAQIVAFKVTKYALILVAGGFLANTLFKSPNIKNWGKLILGLGLIFFGMTVMGDAMKPLRSYQPFLDLMTEMNNPLYAVLVSAAFTGLVQSSSATTVIVITMATQGLVSLEAGIALAMGANVGTCITAGLAAIGKPREAIRAALAHTIFNVVGVLLIIPLIPYFANLLVTFSNEGAAAAAAAAAPRHIANAHTIFNVSLALIFLPFLTPFARLLEWMVPNKATGTDAMDIETLQLDGALTDVPVAALELARTELARMAQTVTGLLEDMDAVVFKADAKRSKDGHAKEAQVLKIHSRLSSFLSKITVNPLATDTADELLEIVAVSAFLKNISHVACANIDRATTTGASVAFRSSKDNQGLLAQYQSAVQRAYNSATSAFLEDDEELALDTLLLVDAMSALEAQLRESSVDHLRNSEDKTDVAAFAAEMEIIANLDQIYHHSNQIAQMVVDDSVDDLVGYGDDGDDDDDDDDLPIVA